VHVYTSRKHHKTVPNKQASKQEIIVPRACDQQASKRLYQELVPNKQASKPEIVANKQAK
jgi:hypothetical protein